MKLILLTATPMFDNSLEILWLINLLLMNDKRPLINKDDIFDKSGNITEKGIKILNYKTRGYISYLRGENPIKFPLRLYPDIYGHPNVLTKFPSKIPNILSTEEDEIDVKEVISDEDKITYLKVLGYPMKGQQLNDYINMSSKLTGSFGSFDQDGLQISNLVYPSNDRDPRKKIGSTGLSKIFSKKIVNKHFKFKLKDEEYKDFLDIKNIGNYSSKIEGILNNIKDSEGVVFIYTQFIPSGVIALALALEYNGYSYWSENKEVELLDTKIEGSDELLEKKKPKKTFNEKNQRFIIISGEKNLSKNTYKNYIDNIQSKNKDGSQVKIIIGSQTAAEGLDFSYIREVHILDPWHHTNKTEQIIGRAIRFCSHIELELKRNVLVYLYASTLGGNLEDYETIDLKTIEEQKINQNRWQKLNIFLR